MSKPQVMWEPDADSRAAAHLAHYMSRVATHYQLAPDMSYADLHAWSVEQPELFWAELADFCGVQFSRVAEAVLRWDDPHELRAAQWFSGARLNFAEHLLRDADATPALIFCDERGRRTELSRAQLAAAVAEFAAGLRALGVGPGDRVAAILPNCPEAVVSVLAAASIGAVFSSCSPDFGLAAIAGRFSQIKPRVLIACDGYVYAGKAQDCMANVQQLADSMPAVEQVIVVPFLNAAPDLTAVSGARVFADIAVKGALPAYAQLPFAHPLYILYSSGTTGKPKCIVHGAGGTLLQHKKELMLHTDLHAGERIFYFTTCGWMMWNWLVSALSVKATLILYDGSPFHPGPEALLSIAARERINVFGTSPRYLTALAKTGTDIPSLPALRTVLSTGAPLAGASYDFVKAQFGPAVQLCSISGGTDLIACFALGNPLLPVYRGELQCRGLGMAVVVYDADGNEVVGETGELVCTQPFPSMPLGFYNDPDAAAYQAAYFERFPGVWTHGDYAELTERGGLLMRGRSDAVLNPAGVRIGSAEVCEPAMTVAAVIDCMAVGHTVRGNEEIVLFAVLAEGAVLDEALTASIRNVIRRAASPRHVPAHVIAVPDIPRTLSGKPVELAVRAVLRGESVRNLEAIANPEALEYFRNRPEWANGNPDSG